MNGIVFNQRMHGEEPRVWNDPKRESMPTPEECGFKGVVSDSILSALKSAFQSVDQE